jgi:hypothetical protein
VQGRSRVRRTVKKRLDLANALGSKRAKQPQGQARSQHSLPRLRYQRRPRTVSRHEHYVPTLSCSHIAFIAVTVLPAHSLVIGTWRRIGTLICFFTRNLRNVTWYLQSESIGYKLEVPWSNIIKITFDGPFAPTMPETVEGVESWVGHAIFELSRPPQFFMEVFRLDSNAADIERRVGRFGTSWRQCTDFTEAQQATTNMTHVIAGSYHDLRKSIEQLNHSDAQFAGQVIFKDLAAQNELQSMGFPNNSAAMPQPPSPALPMLSLYSQGPSLPPLLTGTLHSGENAMSRSFTMDQAGIHHAQIAPPAMEEANHDMPSLALASLRQRSPSLSYGESAFTQSERYQGMTAPSPWSRGSPHPDASQLYSAPVSLAYPGNANVALSAQGSRNTHSAPGGPFGYYASQADQRYRSTPSFSSSQTSSNASRPWQEF